MLIGTRTEWGTLPLRCEVDPEAFFDEFVSSLARERETLVLRSAAGVPELPELHVHLDDGSQETAITGIDVAIGVHADTGALEVAYSTQHYAESTVRAFLSRLVRILAGAAAARERRSETSIFSTSSSVSPWYRHGERPRPPC
ncbi:hypothetical protein GCM10020255_082030 [Rhodococcus baikonurensis]